MKPYKARDAPYDCIIEIEYLPFPSEEKRREAYYTQAKLFLRAKEKELKEMHKKPGTSSLYSK